jgi:hypothetical protein
LRARANTKGWSKLLALWRARSIIIGIAPSGPAGSIQAWLASPRTNVPVSTYTKV